MQTKRILIIDDDSDWLDALKRKIKTKFKEQVTIHCESHCSTGMYELTETRYHLAIVDIGFERDDSGICLIRVCSKLSDNVPVIVVSGMVEDKGKLVNLIRNQQSVINIFFKSDFKENEFVNCVGRIFTYDGGLLIREDGNLESSLNLGKEKIFLNLKSKIMDNEFDIFLCHNSEDKPFVKRIGLDLIQKGILPWIDEWEMSGGERWQAVLEEKINDIPSVAIFVGDGLGPWQKFEMEGFISQSASRGCKIIPVLLPNYNGNDKFPTFLDLNQKVDFRKNDYDQALRLLIRGIRQT